MVFQFIRCNASLKNSPLFIIINKIDILFFNSFAKRFNYFVAHSFNMVLIAKKWELGKKSVTEIKEMKTDTILKLIN